MAPAKCCVIGCGSTKYTHKLFCMPKNEQLRNLWMSFLVPNNPCLLGLAENQLMTKRVCEKHFDRTQFDQMGIRIRYSYPCLFTEDEFTHGVPLFSGEYNVLNEHNYFHERDPEGETTPGELTILRGMADNVLLQEHQYTLPSSSEEANSADTKNTDEAEENPLPATVQSSATPAPQYEGAAVPRRPLADITNKQKNSFEVKTTPLSTEFKVKETSTSRTPLHPSVAHSLQTSKQSASKGASKSIKQFAARTRRFIKDTTRVATNSIGQTGAERLESARKLAERVDLLENFDKLNKKAKAFLLMQLRLARKNKMSRRFSLEEKIFALALIKQSPKGYKLLEHIFALPSKRTLMRLSENVNFECGINERIIRYIKECTKDWDDKKKLCSLVFDEVALTPHLTYDENKEKIDGFVDIADEQKQKFADHALVFMIRGICSSWRQSIAYYFCEGSVSAEELEAILKQIIPKLSEAGLKPLALVCDQGPTFRSCMKHLRATTARIQTSDGQRNDDTVLISGHKLFVFHDPPHLLKSIRNNFLDKDILFEGRKASWRDILYIYDLDSKSGHTRALPNLTADHVNPKKMKKMKVKVAAQVLSARTAAMLNYTHALHQRLNDPQETMETTAAVVLFFDELFDSVNGSPGQGKGKLRSAVKENSEHVQFWRMAIKKLKTMKYIDANSKLARRAGKPRLVRIPCIEGWITTLNSFLGLGKLLLEDHKVKYFYPRFINQDPLENFFGRVRAFNYRNVNPNANAFKYTFKSLLISSILTPQSKFTNCEEDDGETITDFNYLFTPDQCEIEKIMPSCSSTVTLNTPPSSSHNELTEGTTLQKTIAEKVRVQISAYTAGYMCRKITKKNPCDICITTYTTKDIDNTHELITYREYKRLKNNNNLTYPNGKILRLYRQSAQYIHGYLNKYCHHAHIKKHLVEIISDNCDMSWLGCKTHAENIKTYFVELIIRLQVHNWCNIINKILNGKIEEKYVLKMGDIQKAAFKKYITHKSRQKATKSKE